MPRGWWSRSCDRQRICRCNLSLVWMRPATLYNCATQNLIQEKQTQILSPARIQFENEQIISGTPPKCWSAPLLNSDVLKLQVETLGKMSLYLQKEITHYNEKNDKIFDWYEYMGYCKKYNRADFIPSIPWIA
jgi:hypothetical protein